MMGVALVISLCLAVILDSQSADATTLTIDNAFTDCGGSFDVLTTSEIVVLGRGNGVASCHVTFNAEVKDECLGLCFHIRNATFVKGNKTEGENSLSIAAGADTRTFKYTNPYIGTVCTKATSLALSVTGNTGGTDDAPTFTFEVGISNNCGDNSISFLEAVDLIEGFDHGDAFKDKESLNFFRGLGLGLGLAFVWLIVLLVVFICLRCNPRASRYSVKPSTVGEDKVPLTKSGLDVPDINIELAPVAAARPTELKFQN